MARYYQGDMEGARAALEPLAQAGNFKAQHNLGVMMREGKGGSKNLTEALSWFRKAAEQGSAMSDRVVGAMYEAGEGVPEDKAEAARWYRIAADKADAIAQYDLGWLYWRGEGVAKDAPTALSWWRKSADQGTAEAQYALAIAHAKDAGGGEVSAEAYYWMRRAAAQGLAEAIPLAERLRSAAHRDELAEVAKFEATMGAIPKDEAARVEVAKLQASKVEAARAEAARVAEADAAAAEAVRKFVAGSTAPSAPTPSAPSSTAQANSIIGQINGEQQNYRTNVQYAKNWFDRGEMVEACRYYQKQIDNMSALRRLYGQLNDVKRSTEYTDEIAQYEQARHNIYENENDDCREAGVRLSY